MGTLHYYFRRLFKPEWKKFYNSMYIIHWHEYLGGSHAIRLPAKIVDVSAVCEKDAVEKVRDIVKQIEDATGIKHHIIVIGDHKKSCDSLLHVNYRIVIYPSIKHLIELGILPPLEYFGAPKTIVVPYFTYMEK